MGAECTRSYQAEANSFETKRILVKEGRKTEKEIIISMLINNRRNEGISGRNEKLIFYTKTLNSFIPSCKFNSDTGFQNGPSHSRLMDNEVQFSLSADTTRTNRLDIKGSDDLQLWRKVNTFGEEFNEGDEMIIGNKVMKLKYVLNQNEISYEKEKSTIKLALCKEEDAECRFCLEKAIDDTNPLVMPCKCLGSVSAVHQKCLSNWIFNTSGSFQETMPTFSFKVKHAECEICKFSFENYIWNRMMVVFSAFSGDYVIFQIKNDEPNKKEQKSKEFIIFKFGENVKQMTIGKSNKCHYSLNDQCFSEINTTLSLVGGKLHIEDNDSKLGTFIKEDTRRLVPENSYKLGNLYFSIKNAESSPKGRKNQTLRY